MSSRLREPDAPDYIIEIAKKHLPCTCGDIYLSRKLTAPDCPYHAFDWEDFAEEVIVAANQKPSALSAQGNVSGVEVKGLASDFTNEIYSHINSLHYEGGLPEDWKETLANHLAKKFTGYSSSKAKEDCFTKDELIEKLLPLYGESNTYNLIEHLKQGK